MKKFLATVSAVAMTLTLTACGSKPASSAAASSAASTSEPEVVEAEGKYTVYNGTGEKVTELTIVENGSSEKAENYAGEGMRSGKTIEITKKAMSDAVFTLTYKTESGREGKFETLYVEEAPITLLAEDAMTGATPIAFAIPEGEGKYTVYNTTGETVTELTVVENGKDGDAENYAGEGLADGESVEITKKALVNASFTLTYKTESGREGKFETLHIEETPISLLAEDAMTGATQIAFSAPEK